MSEGAVRSQKISHGAGAATKPKTAEDASRDCRVSEDSPTSKLVSYEISSCLKSLPFSEIRIEWKGPYGR